MQEDKVADNSYFITLTYANENVPLSPNGFMTVSKRHIQLFLKVLRKAHSGNGKSDIKYYAASEYGSKTNRPHYHLIMFNLDLTRMFDRKDLMILEKSDYDGKSHVQCYQWKYGIASVGKVTGASIGYSLKYLSKPRKFKIHARDDRTREFALMSKGLGRNYIGKPIYIFEEWLHRNKKNGKWTVRKYRKQLCFNYSKFKAWHHADLVNRMYVNLEEGKKASMPRYYKQKLYTDTQRGIISLHQASIIEEKHKQEIAPYLESGAMEQYLHDKREFLSQQYFIMYKKAKNNESI